MSSPSLSDVNLVTGRAADAIDSLEQLRAAGVDNPAVRYNFAYRVALEIRFADARDLLGPLIQASDTLPRAQLLLARTTHRLDDIDAALVHITRYTDLQPDHAEACALIHLD